METAQGLGPVPHVSSRDFTPLDTIPGVVQNFGGGLATAQCSPAVGWVSPGAQSPSRTELRARSHALGQEVSGGRAWEQADGRGRGRGRGAGPGPRGGAGPPWPAGGGGARSSGIYFTGRDLTAVTTAARQQDGRNG